jgi:hypothetical protein
MNLERIERALREGPVDEPRYVPGAFGPTRRLDRLVLTAAVAAALAIGLVIGLALDVLRSPTPNVGTPGPDPAVIQRQLEGTWRSKTVTRDEFVAFMLERGHAQADLDAFLGHDPITTTLRWGLDFDLRGTLLVFSVTGDGITDILSSGPYEILPDGRLRWTDETCVLVAAFTVDDEQLTFGSLDPQDCNSDERIATDAFFGLASPYELSIR